MGTKFKATQKNKAPRRATQDADMGPRQSGNVGSSVSDGAGTRSRAGLPPETVAMKAPKADLPKAAQELAATVLPVPAVDDKPINAFSSWDMDRDRKLGNSRSPKK